MIFLRFFFLNFVCCTAHLPSCNLIERNKEKLRTFPSDICNLTQRCASQNSFDP